MRKIFQYILMAVAVVVTTSCSNELDEALQSVGNGTLQFVVSDFPAFGEDPQTRASSLGTPDAGKTAWEEGDKLLMFFDSPRYGRQTATLTYTDSQWTLPDGETFIYLQGETPEITVFYAPICELHEDMLVTEEQLGTCECLEGTGSLSDDGMSISIMFGDRTYSRLRIVAVAGQELTVTTTDFTPAGMNNASSETYTICADEKGNAYLYGTFAEGATVTVKTKYGETTLAEYNFTEATEQDKSYALYAGARFSVSADKKVLFSPGNLQYTQSTQTWSFAENQYDYIGSGNLSDGVLADKIDLFGWSTDNPATPFGVSNSTEDADYFGNFVDWGTNSIGNNAPGTWRTLTEAEWEYLLNTRSNASSLIGVAQVNGVNGLILLPDNWSAPNGVTFKSGSHSESSSELYAQYQTFTPEQWALLEKSGAVFLPAAGYCVLDFNEVSNVQEFGYYWSATESDKYGAYSLFFSSKGMSLNDGYRFDGRSVRLVKDL